MKTLSFLSPPSPAGFFVALTLPDNHHPYPLERLAERHAQRHGGKAGNAKRADPHELPLPHLVGGGLQFRYGNAFWSVGQIPSRKASR